MRVPVWVPPVGYSVAAAMVTIELLRLGWLEASPMSETVGATAAAAFTLAAIVALRNQSRGAFIAVLGVSFAAGFAPTANSRLTELERESLVSPGLEVLFLRWSPGPGPLRVVPLAELDPAVRPSFMEPQLSLTDRDLVALDSVGLTGRIAIHDTVVSGWGRRPRTLVVLSHQLERSPTELVQSDGGLLAYVQRGAAFDTYPPGARPAGPTLRLEVPDRADRRIWYSIELADGRHFDGWFEWARP